MPTTTAIYARLSVDRDADKIGIDNQLKDTRALASRLGYEVVEEYIDRNLTAGDKLVTRPEYDRMYQDALAGQFSRILVWDLDRLTRQPRQLEDWIDLAEEHNRFVATYTEGIDLSTETGRTYARIKAAVARQELQNMKKRAKRNAQGRAENGSWHGGSIPYGYRDKHGQIRNEAGKLVSKVELVPNAREVKLILEAANRILEGDSMHSIVADWNQRNITTRFGKHWRQSNLRAILTNRTLLGETKAGAKATWEPIIEQRTFDRLARVFNDPARKVTHSPGVKGGKYSMGGGISVCAICGNRLITGGKRTEPWNKSSPIRPILKCTSIVNGPTACNSVVVDHDRLEAFVFETLIVSFQSNERWNQRLGEKDPEVDAKIDNLETRLADLQEQQRRINELYIAGDIDRLQHSEQVQRVKDESVAIQRQRDELLGKPLLSKALESGIENWRDWPPMKRRSFLKQVVARVEVGQWPEGMSRTLPRRKEDTDETLSERREAHLLEVMKRRAHIFF